MLNNIPPILLIIHITPDRNVYISHESLRSTIYWWLAIYSFDFFLLFSPYCYTEMGLDKGVLFFVESDPSFFIVSLSFKHCDANSCFPV